MQESGYGFVADMTVASGKRDEVIALLREGTKDMPGNRLYLIAEDKADADRIWIVEAWDSAEAHAASLKLPSVIDAIGKARPMIAGMGSRIEFAPVSGV